MGQESIGGGFMCPAMQRTTDRFLGYYKWQTEEYTNIDDKKKDRTEAMLQSGLKIGRKSTSVLLLRPSQCTLPGTNEN